MRRARPDGAHRWHPRSSPSCKGGQAQSCHPQVCLVCAHPRAPPRAPGSEGRHPVLRQGRQDEPHPGVLPRRLQRLAGARGVRCRASFCCLQQRFIAWLAPVPVIWVTPRSKHTGLGAEALCQAVRQTVSPNKQACLERQVFIVGEGGVGGRGVVEWNVYLRGRELRAITAGLAKHRLQHTAGKGRCIGQPSMPSWQHLPLATPPRQR